MEKCQWKLVPSDKFILGQSADRCGQVAAIKILRPNRKTDLFLCEHHLNEFIAVWGLHYEVKLLGPRLPIKGYARIYVCPHDRADCDCGGNIL